MGRKACVFVDGENFRHSITALFEDFRERDYLPKRAQWKSFFDWIVSEVSGEDAERIRTYWYVIESLDFYPYRFPDAEKDSERLKRLLCQYPPFKSLLDPLRGDELTRTMKAKVGQLYHKKDRMRRRFDGWVALQNGIVSRHEAIEFRRAGCIRYNLYDGSLGPEKAVDVKLATDLIVLRDIYDVAIIVSGDQDYVPAVQVVKDSGKRVVNVAFRTRDGQLLPGGARRLNQLADWSLEISFQNMARFMNIGSSGNC